ncbi:DUF2169 family type VI secretion system accessory protein [Alcaligenes sp. SDU_A2]|uniref:DUF2169 family type VI secretion system accessory protein n=1 Tax=Alcaligenes sp. SDU_A2 TaxID=3136634 RepID=UPI00311DE2EE
MDIDKPDDVLLMQAYHAQAGQPRWIVTLGYVWQEGGCLPEAQAWPWLLAHFPDEAFDAGLKKTRGGYGVAGQAWAPPGQRTTAMAVRVQLGALQKSLHVHGARRWERTLTGWRPSAAEPFQSLPLTLRQAYGGPGYNENPYGSGCLADPEQAQGTLLPHTEHPDAPVLSPADRWEPAILTRLPAGAGSRMRWVGAVDERWEKERFPWLPDDTDPRLFDAFPQDQVQEGFWQGNESWRVQGMHPQRPDVSGRLPGLRPRLLVRRKESEQIEEAILDLDTVWLFPQDERVLMLYRASIPVRRADAADIAAAAVFTEYAHEPAGSLPQLQARWAAMHAAAGVEGSSAMHDSPDDADTDLPGEMSHAADLPQADPHIMSQLEDSLEQGREQGNAWIADMEQRLAPYSPVSLPRIAPLAAVASIAKADDADPMQSIETALQQGQQELVTQVKDVAKRLELDAGPLLALAQLPRMPSAPVPVDVLAEIQAAKAGFPDVPSSAFDALEEQGASLQAELAEMDQRLDSLAAELAVLQAGLASQGTPDLVIDSLEQFHAHRQAGHSLAGCALTGLDLRGVGLDGADLSGAVLQACNLAGEQIDALNLVGARLQDCDLQGVVLTAARLAAGQWENCALEGGVFAQAQAERLGLSGCRLAGSDWRAAQMDGADLSQCSMDQASFAQAVLRGATFSGAQGLAVDFVGAQMVDVRLDSQCVLRQADVRSADMRAASLQDSDLVGSRFDQSDLSDAFLHVCDLSGTTGWQVQAPRAIFKEVNWTGARWPGANFLDAAFDYALIEQTDWRGANLYGAQLGSATVRSVDLDGALLGHLAAWARHAQGGTSQ